MFDSKEIAEKALLRAAEIRAEKKRQIGKKSPGRRRGRPRLRRRLGCRAKPRVKHLVERWESRWESMNFDLPVFS